MSYPIQAIINIILDALITFVIWYLLLERFEVINTEVSYNWLPSYTAHIDINRNDKTRCIQIYV